MVELYYGIGSQEVSGKEGTIEWIAVKSRVFPETLQKGAHE